MVVYTSSLAEITPAKLQGFFVGWRWPLTPARHLEILERASNRVLAVDTDQDRAVGFITALSDGLQSAFITHFEVLPEYQAQGIGDELMRRMLEQLAEIANVDLTCDPKLQPFYRRFGMRHSAGMVLRREPRGPRT